jgi:hypothetical protein
VWWLKLYQTVAGGWPDFASITKLRLPQLSFCWKAGHHKPQHLHVMQSSEISSHLCLLLLAAQRPRKSLITNTRKSCQYPEITRLMLNKAFRRHMEFWQCFSSHKQWVELQFMAQAARRRFAVSKPWGDTCSYDVGIEHGENFLRVQVKSTIYRVSAGYLCQFKPNHRKKLDYSPKQLDLFAAYVIPEDVWYFIPATLLLGKRRYTMAMLSPVVPPKKKSQLPLRMLPRSLGAPHEKQGRINETHAGSKEGLAP